MKTKFLPLAFLIACCSLLCSCFEVNSVLKLNKDGSGTYEMTVVKPGAGGGGAADLLGSLLGGGKPVAGRPGPIPTRKELEAKAKTMGEGVTLASLKEIQEKTGEHGYKAVYAFDDINTLTITGAEAIEELADQVKKGAAKGQKPIRFVFTPGDVAQLVMKNPNKVQKNEGASAPSTKGKKDKAPQQGMELVLISQMFKGTKINFELQVNGKITRTNALHAEGNRITLVNVDFDQASKDDKFMAALKKATEGTVPNVRQLDGIEGIEVDTQEKVEVEFK